VEVVFESVAMTGVSVLRVAMESKSLFAAIGARSSAGVSRLRQ